MLLSGCMPGSRPLEIVLTTPTPSQSQGIEVHLSGAVANPGIYTITEGDTLGDVIRMAGGSTAGMDYSEIEVYISPLTKSSLSESQKVNINTAEEWLLRALPGIGSQRAGAIIDYRERNGHFKYIEELLDVPGIGPSIFEEIKDLVTVVD